MTQRARLQRPPLERTTPIRNVGKAFQQTGEKPKAKPSAPSGAEQAGAEQVGSGLEDAVSEGVRLGYSVIEDQIRQAQGLAGKLNPGSYGLLGGGLAGGNDEIKALLNRLLRTYGDLTTVWLEVLKAALGNTDILSAILGKEQAKAPDPAPRGTAHRNPDEAAPAPLNALSVSITAKGPVETDIRFFGGHGEAATFALQDLRSRENGAPPLDDIALIPAADGEAIRIAVRVPDEQPPGLYQGLILDQRTDAPVGVLGIRVGSS